MTSGTDETGATLRSVGYAYPWDYEGDPAAAERAVGLGLDAVALAAAYHATRAGTPWHPRHRVIDARWDACYVPVRGADWSGQRLVPLEPTWTMAPDSFSPARRQLTDQGLGVEAWIVLTHNLAQGLRHPDLVVRNAFGDAYSYGLCPSAEEVQEYCVTLVRTVLTAAPVSGVVLESCGPMGFDHGGEHEKTEFAGWDEEARSLFSLCFCRACTGRYRVAGIDVDRLRARVRQGVEAGSATLQEALGSLASAVAEVRTGIATELRTLLIDQVRAVAPDARVTIHGSPDPWATGSFTTVRPALGDGVDVVVGSCWEVAEGADRLRRLRESTPGGVAVGAYLRLDRDWSEDPTTRRRLREYLDAGMSELHLYHLGLLGRKGLETLHDVVDAARELAGSESRGPSTPAPGR
jgi:hypothetical protein